MEEKNSEASDVELLRKAAAGDARAFHALIDRHSDRLYRLAVSLVGNASDAEDVLQEAAVGAYRGLARFESRSSVSTWLTRILIIQAARWRRNRKRSKLEPLDAINPAVKRDSIIGVDMKIDLNAALQTLSPEHREILVLREFEQLNYEEMAVVLGVPRGTVESRLHRARGELREKLKGYLT